MPLFEINDGTGFNMNYEIHEGVVPQTTLFIHGNLASNRWWYPAEQEWTRKAKGKNWKGSLVYAEFRGCGKSTTPRSEADVNMHTFANDYISLIKGLNLGQVNLVGHSTGGLIVALMLAKAPELFNKAVMLDPVGAQGVTFDPSMDVAFEAMKADKNLTATVIGSTIHGNNPETDFFKQIVIEDAYSAVKAVGSWVLKALNGFDGEAEIKKVNNKALVLHGEHDVLLSMDESKKLALLMKNSEFRVIPGHGHCTNVEDPALFVKIVDEFLFA